uniref:Complex I-B14.7 n=1 Tax=Rhabditophanes sp. KR3021 TaxID=114890 RepID=A0AC35THT0_9BILA
MTGGDHAEMRAEYRVQRPPWVGLYTGTEYKGRTEWWTEAGYKSETPKGEFKIQRPKFKEEDSTWFDAKVADGTSNAGPLGLDSQYNKNVSIKGDTPGDLGEFQDNVFKSSAQFKNIAAKFNLSKEHPGFAVNPTFESFQSVKKDMLGRIPFFPNSWHHLGPRFFNKPLNEGTFEKGLVGLKYAAIFLGPYTMGQIKAFETVKVDNLTARTFIKQYLKNAPVPMAVAFTWGVALSASASIRNRDDCINHLYASGAVGSVVGTMKGNFSLGLTVAIISTILGTFWQYQRWSRDGLQGRVSHPKVAGFQTGPLAWQFLQQGDHQVPTELY